MSTAALRCSRPRGAPASARASCFRAARCSDAASRGRSRDDAEPSPDTDYGAAKAALEAFVRERGARAGRSLRSARRASTASSSRSSGASGSTSSTRRSTAWRSSRAPGPKCMATTWRGGVAAAHGPPERVAGRMFNCSDIVVSNRDIVSAGAQVRGDRGPLPEEGRRRTGIMRTDALGGARRRHSAAGRSSRKRSRSSSRRSQAAASRLALQSPTPIRPARSSAAGAAPGRVRAPAAAPSPGPAAYAGRAPR